MQCEEARDQFTDYLSDSLVEPARADLQAHLIACESCRGEADALKNIWTRLDSIPAEKPESAAMRARFDVMVEAYRHGMDHASRVSWWDSLNGWVGKWWPQQPALQFGLVVAVVLIAVVTGYQRTPVNVASPATPTQVVEIAQMRSELRDMHQMVALSLMQQQSASERLKGVSWSNQIDRPDTEILTQLMDTLMHDTNINVRLAAIDALKKFAERQIVRSGVLTALSRQDSPMVQTALIDYMVEMNQKESVPTLHHLAQDTAVNEVVRKRAEWGLEQLQ